MRALLIAAAASLISFGAFATPPYDLTVDFEQRSGGPASGYRLYINGAPAGDVISAMKLAGKITADGVYEFCVRGYNATGEGPATGACLSATIDDFDPPPGPVDVTRIVIECDIAETTPSCTVSYQ